MLRRYWREALLVLAVGIVLLSPIYAAVTSPEFSDCQKHQGHYPTPDSKENKPSTALVPALGEIRIGWDCIGGYTNANGAAITAIATLIMAIFTGTLWLVTSRALRLARDEFNATHRPKIVIHSIKFEPIVSESGDFDLSKAAATVTFYNTGPSSAVIEGIKYSILQRRTPLESGIFPHTEAVPKHKTIESGMGDYIELGSDIEIRNIRTASDRNSRLVLIGKIFYRDKAGGLRQTGFCRSLLGGGSQGMIWGKMDEPEYEYDY